MYHHLPQICSINHHFKPAFTIICQIICHHVPSFVIINHHLPSTTIIYHYYQPYSWSKDAWPLDDFSTTKPQLPSESHSSLDSGHGRPERSGDAQRNPSGLRGMEHELLQRLAWIPGQVFPPPPQPLVVMVKHQWLQVTSSSLRINDS